jgi:hypothetical protein
VPFDASDDKSTLTNKMAHALDGLIFNARDLVRDTEGKPSASNQILEISQFNLMGHVYLLET